MQEAENYLGEFANHVAEASAKSATSSLQETLTSTLETMQDARILLMEAFLIKALRKYHESSLEDTKVSVANVITRQRSDLTSSPWKLDKSMLQPNLVLLSDAILEPKKTDTGDEEDRKDQDAEEVAGTSEPAS